MIELSGKPHERWEHFLKPTKIKEPRKLPARNRQKAIPKVSPKRKEENKVYAKLREKFLRERPTCEVQWDAGCVRKSSHVHHAKRRGKFLLDVSTWMSACYYCHTMLHDHPAESLKKGFLVKI